MWLAVGVGVVGLRLAQCVAAPGVNTHRWLDRDVVDSVGTFLAKDVVGGRYTKPTVTGRRCLEMALQRCG